MVQLALAADAVMPQPNQIDRKRRRGYLRPRLARFPGRATRSEQGLLTNVSVGVQYLEAWLRGHGAVPLFNLMEDAATWRSRVLKCGNGFVIRAAC
jgi:malate synthase